MEQDTSICQSGDTCFGGCSSNSSRALATTSSTKQATPHCGWCATPSMSSLMAIMEDKAIYYFWSGWGMYVATIREKNILVLVKGSNVTSGVIDVRGMSLAGLWEYLIIWGRWEISHWGKLEIGVRASKREKVKRVGVGGLWGVYNSERLHRSWEVQGDR